MTEFISIRGAPENNLKDVTLQIPKRKLESEGRLSDSSTC
jgi:excinuclease UvrABC ATPase subunit